MFIMTGTTPSASSLLPKAIQALSNARSVLVSRSVSSTPSISPTDNTGYDFSDYLRGLLSSTGAEHETNRAYNSAEAQKNRDFQSQEAEINRQWYEYMSNSAYQRAIADMKAAGINPILAYSSGGAASATFGSPSGSAASYNTGSGDTLSSIISSVADLVSALTGNSSKVMKYLKTIVK